MGLVESVFWRKHCYEHCWENVSWATTWQMEGEGLPKVHGRVSSRGSQDNQIVKVIVPSLGLTQTSRVTGSQGLHKPKDKASLSPHSTDDRHLPRIGQKEAKLAYGTYMAPISWLPGSRRLFHKLMNIVYEESEMYWLNSSQQRKGGGVSRLQLWNVASGCTERPGEQSCSTLKTIRFLQIAERKESWKVKGWDGRCVWPVQHFSIKSFRE